VQDRQWVVASQHPSLTRKSATSTSVIRLLKQELQCTASHQGLPICQWHFDVVAHGRRFNPHTLQETSILLIVCCSEISDPNWRWIADHFSEEDVRFDFIDCCPRNWVERQFKFLNLARLRGSLEAVLKAKRNNAAILVSHGPTLAAWNGIFARLILLQSAIIAHSFNFVKLPNSLKTRIFSIGLSRVDRFVVFSRIEIDVYARQFHIPKNRFSFVHWGIQRPTTRSAPLYPSKSYVSAIGGNARDYGTLIEAARLLPDIPFVLVVRPSSLEGLVVPANVTVHINLSLEATMNVLFESYFMVLPLNSSEVPCGHVTIVAAMHLGRTMIVTASTGLADYVKDGENALTVPVASTPDLVQAIARLWLDDSLRQSLEKNSLRFATDQCTEENIAQHFLQQMALLRMERR
jgi:glycosyltransferase involved in cell wall biosynthesis